MGTYSGTDDATRETVKRYLTENYSQPDGVHPMSDECAEDLMSKHNVAMQKGISLMSHARYVGDQIADAEKLDWVGDDDDDDDED